MSVGCIYSEGYNHGLSFWRCWQHFDDNESFFQKKRPIWQQSFGTECLFIYEHFSCVKTFKILTCNDIKSKRLVGLANDLVKNSQFKEVRIYLQFFISPFHMSASSKMSLVIGNWKVNWSNKSMGEVWKYANDPRIRTYPWMYCIHMSVGENPADLYHKRAICYAKVSQLNEAHADCDKSIEVYTMQIIAQHNTHIRIHANTCILIVTSYISKTVENERSISLHYSQYHEKWMIICILLRISICRGIVRQTTRMGPERESIYTGIITNPKFINPLSASLVLK